MEIDKNNIESSLPFQSKTLITAFYFNINMNLEELRSFLSEQMKSEWTSKHSEFFGDYIGLRKKDTQTIIRIFVQNDGYLVDMLNRIPEVQTEWKNEIEKLQSILQEGGCEKFIPAENNY